MAFMECTGEMYAHYGGLVDAKEKEFADFPDKLKIKMQTSVTREEALKRHDEHWANADQDQDGLLNEEEFLVFADSPEFNEELYRRIWKALKQGEERFMANKLEGGISKDAMKPYMSVVATKRMEQHRWRGEAPKFESSTPAPAQEARALAAVEAVLARTAGPSLARTFTTAMPSSGGATPSAGS
eukprot:CAMPEP_0185289398 /NCGR_PEP_ID=MMETSP1363-20130426/3893_1 /TAXON_ID=38817 /ORGANISM="Gephyrocapsa oceanica, Strain RCC1303" /LENGTH=184 /DNA_ID=CAMNT_0027885289 /DNA_START=13 /DNA_END=569 /DNA_ORIENTATION=+